MSVASAKNYMHKDGAEWVIGDDGTMQVKSGGEINVESGGLLDVEAGATLKVSGRIDRAASVELFDDFLGDVLEDAWSGAKGTDAPPPMKIRLPGRIMCGHASSSKGFMEEDYQT